MAYMERVYISQCDLLSLCFDHGFYTLGNSADYENMLAKLWKANSVGITFDSLLDIAQDITRHSERFDLGYVYYSLCRIKQCFLMEIE